jgi:xylose dehydrogenase (NAD/NADP)
MPDRKIRWGVLGYARIARETLIPAILRSSNSEFHAIASREESKLAECRARYAVAKTYRGYEALLADPEIDAVYIPLPNALHREWTLRAAEHGKHVLCEKPIGLNATEAREMTEACQRHGVLLMEAFMYRYTERTRQVLEVIRSGVLGEIRHISATFRFLLAYPASIKLKPDLGGGALYDVGCYPVNFIGMIADELAGAGPGTSRPESVSVQSVMRGGVDMNFSALLKYSSGLVGALHCGIDSHKRVCAEIIGTLGVLEVPDTFFDNPSPLVLTVGEERREIAVPASDRYRLEVEDFARAILTRGQPQFGLAETIRNMEVIDRLFAASR